MPYKHERRSGKDRREEELGSPGKIDLRRHVEARRPEILEIELSETEWEKHFGGDNMSTAKFDAEAASEILGRVR